MDFNLTFVIAFFSFIAFIFLMNLILYKPMNSIIEKRKKYIEDNYTLAHNNIEGAHAILQAREDRILNTETECAKKVLDVRQNLKSLGDKKTKDAKIEAQEQFSKAKNEIAEEEKDAKIVLKNEITSLAQMISDKFIQNNEKITVPDDKELEELLR